MHSFRMSSRLNHWPSLIRTRKNNNSIAGQTTRRILIETFIETWISRVIEISSRRVGSHVCQPSLLTILMIPHSLPHQQEPIYQNQNYGTLNSTWWRCFANEMWCCVWSTVLWRLLTDASMSGSECSSDKCHIVYLTLATDRIHPFTVFDQVFLKMTILLHLYKWKNVQRR